MNIARGPGCGGGGPGGVGVVAMRSSSPFTVSQWQELEHQALILKYLRAGLPVPPELLLPIQKSFEFISQRFFHHLTKWVIAPSTGRRWIQSRDDAGGLMGRSGDAPRRHTRTLKYCERHMHRGLNRSREPVESQTMIQSSSTLTSLTVSESNSGSLQSLPLHAFGSPQGSISGTNQSHYSLDSIPYGIPCKGYRYLQGLKPDVGEYSFFSEPSGRNIGIQTDAQLDNTWPLMQSRVSLLPSKSTGNTMLQHDYPQHSFFNGAEYVSGGSVKQEGQPLRPFFDKWPKTQEASGLEDDRSNQTLFSATQLSISIPMASSDFSTSSHSPHGN